MASLPSVFDALSHRSGFRVLSDYITSNHIHVLLEVPSGCEKRDSFGLTDEELIYRVGGLYTRNGTLQDVGLEEEGDLAGWAEGFAGDS